MKYEIYQKLIFDYINKNKLLFTIYALLIVGYNIFYIAALSKIKTKILSSLNIKDNISKDIYNHPTFNFIMLFVFAYIIITILTYLIYYLEAIIMNDYNSYIRNTIFENTISSHNESFEEIQTGDHITRTTMLKREIKYLVNNFLKRFSLSVFEILIITAFICYTNLKLGIILISFIIFLIFSHFYFGKQIISGSEKNMMNCLVCQKKCLIVFIIYRIFM